MSETPNLEGLDKSKYNKSDLELEVNQWVAQQSSISERSRVHLSDRTSLDLFINYQNNFWMTLRTACRYIDDEGKIKNFGDLETQQFKEGVIERQHMKEIHEVVMELGYSFEIFRNLDTPFTDDQKEMLRNIWVKMRSKGFERSDLAG